MSNTPAAQLMVWTFSVQIKRSSNNMTAKKGFSRRTFLKGTGAALAGTAFGVSGHFKTQGIFAPNVVRAQDQVVLAVQEFAHPALEEILPKFEEETGLKVVLEGGPASGIDMRRA
jgi:ABC-type glycerol-3-phosphate transport system substrate-binding protein